MRKDVHLHDEELDAHWLARARALLERAVEAVPLAGGPVKVPLDELRALFVCLSMIRNDLNPVTRIAADPDEPFAALLRDHGAVEADGPDGTLVALPEAPYKLYVRDWLEALSLALGQLPAGTELRLDLFGVPEDATMCLVGPVRGDTWHIEQTGPPMPAAALAKGLAIGRQVLDEASPFVVETEAEADLLGQLVEREAETFMEPVHRHGLTFVPDRYEREDLGALLLRLHHAEDLPLSHIALDSPGDSDALRRMMEMMGQAAAAPGEPPPGEGDWSARGALVFEGQSGAFHAVDLDALTPDPAELARRTESLTALGFPPIADLLCDAMPDVALRACGMPGGFAYAVIYQPRYDAPAVEIYTTFEDGSSLTTSQWAGGEDLPAADIYRQSAPELPLDELGVLHFGGVQARTLQHDAGRPQGIEPTPEAVARALDAFLVRQAGG